MTPRKTNLPLDQCRCHLETGNIYLVCSLNHSTIPPP